jgi:hypothetical protein
MAEENNSETGNEENLGDSQENLDDLPFEELVNKANGENSNSEAEDQEPESKGGEDEGDNSESSDESSEENPDDSGAPKAIKIKDKSGNEIDAPDYLLNKDEKTGELSLKSPEELAALVQEKQNHILSTRNPNNELLKEIEDLKAERDSLKTAASQEKPVNIYAEVRKELDLPIDKDEWTPEQAEEYEAAVAQRVIKEARAQAKAELREERDTLDATSKTDKQLKDLQDVAKKYGTDEFKTTDTLLEIDGIIKNGGTHPDQEAYNKVSALNDEYQKWQPSPADFYKLQHLDGIIKGFGEKLTQAKADAQKELATQIKKNGKGLPTGESKNIDMNEDELDQLYKNNPDMSLDEILSKAGH